MKGICLMWSRGRHFSPSLPAWRQVSETWLQMRSPGRNLGEHRLVRRSGTTSRGTALLVFRQRMRSFLKLDFLPSVCVGKSNRVRPITQHCLRREVCFLKVSETCRAYFGWHNSLLIVATPRPKAIQLRSRPGFCYIKNMFKDQLFRTSGLQFDYWFVGTFEKQTLGSSTYAEYFQ